MSCSPPGVLKRFFRELIQNSPASVDTGVFRQDDSANWHGLTRHGAQCRFPKELNASYFTSPF
jgi:hypothetical protein